VPSDRSSERGSPYRVPRMLEFKCLPPVIDTPGGRINTSSGEHRQNEVRTTQPGVVKVALRWSGRTIGVGVIEADDLHLVRAGLALGFQKGLPVDLIVVSAVDARDVRGSDDTVNQRVGVASPADKDAAAFVRVAALGVSD